MNTAQKYSLTTIELSTSLKKTVATVMAGPGFLKRGPRPPLEPQSGYLGATSRGFHWVALP